MAVKTSGLRIRTKLLALVMLMVIISIVVGGASLYGLSRVLEQYKTPQLPALKATYNLDAITAKARLCEKEFFLFSRLGNTPELKKKQGKLHTELFTTYKKIPPALKAIIFADSGNFSDQKTGRKLRNDIRIAYNATMNHLSPLASEILAGKSFPKVSQLYTDYNNSVNTLEESIGKLRNHLSRSMDSQRQAAVTFEAKMVATLLGLSLGMILLSVLAGLYVSNRITTPLNQIMEGIETVGQGEIVELSVTSKDEFAEIARIFNATIDRIKAYLKTDEQRQATEENVINFLEVVSEAADGDLTLRAPVTNDVFGSIADAYNLMIESLADLLTDTTINAEEVGEESRQLLEIFQSMKEGADSQLQHVSNATDAAKDTAASATQIANKTALAQQASTKVDEATSLGHERVNHSIEGMQLIRVTVQVINKKMKTLAERLLEIGTISQLISDVATRTTILAMNASIEASRAGEQGRGFLVISDEIKRLADESSEATRQIGGIIKAIQSVANEVTVSLEEETSTVEEQTRVAQDTGEALAAIHQATNESKQVVTEITKLSQEQQKISDGMVVTILKMAEITAGTASLITSSSQISEGLNGVSESLLQSLGQFQLSAAEEPTEIGTDAAEDDIVANTFPVTGSE